METVAYCVFSILVPSEPPTQMEAILLNSSAVYLKWKPPPPNSHNGILRNYQVINSNYGVIKFKYVYILQGK
jgi:hypothetical protein